MNIFIIIIGQVLVTFSVGLGQLVANYLFDHYLCLYPCQFTIDLIILIPIKYLIVRHHFQHRPTVNLPAPTAEKSDHSASSVALRTFVLADRLRGTVPDPDILHIGVAMILTV